MKRFAIPFLGLVVLLGWFPLGASADSSSQTAQYVCVIVLDGGKPEYITNHLNQMPTVKQLLKTGRWYDHAWVGDLMSITPPGHAVIGTGSLPKNDGGIVNWDWGIHSTGKISPTMQAQVSYQNGWAFKIMRDSGTPTLAGVIHTKYSNGLVIAGSGAHFHAAGPLGGPDANWIFSYDRIKGNWAPYTLGQHPVPSKLLSDPSLRTKLAGSNNSSVPLLYDPLPLGQQDTLVMNFAIKALQQNKPRAMLLNLAEVDTVGHWSHAWSREEGVLYAAFDKDLGRLINAYKQAGIYNQTLFIITADHGMIQSKTRVLDREAVVKQIHDTLGVKSTILTNGGGSAGPTMTSIWLKNPADNPKMAKAIFNKHYDNVSAIFYMVRGNGPDHYDMAGCEQCSPQLVEAYKYLVSTEAGPNGEDIAILLRENSRNSGMPDMPGRHGGADWGSQHITMFLSGPGVAAGTSHAPARLADIAPTVERFMGITPNARDGVVLADAFQHPDAGDTSKQTDLNAKLTPMVDALIQRGQSDTRLEVSGKLANHIPSNENIIHWKRRWAVTIAGAVVFLGTLGGMAWAIAEVRRQGTGLTWTE